MASERKRRRRIYNSRRQSLFRKACELAELTGSVVHVYVSLPRNPEKFKVFYSNLDDENRLLTCHLRDDQIDIRPLGPSDLKACAVRDFTEHTMEEDLAKLEIQEATENDVRLEDGFGELNLVASMVPTTVSNEVTFGQPLHPDPQAVVSVDPSVYTMSDHSSIISAQPSLPAIVTKNEAEFWAEDSLLADQHIFNFSSNGTSVPHENNFGQNVKIVKQPPKLEFSFENLPS